MKIIYSDADIITGIRNADEIIYTYLWDTTYPEVKQMFRKKWTWKVWDLLHTEKATTVLSNGLLVLIQKIQEGSFIAKKEGACRGFLLKYCREKSINLYEKEKTYQTKYKGDVKWESIFAESLEDDESETLSKKKAIILLALGKLGGTCEKILFDFYFGGNDNEEIAYYSNYTIGYVKKKKSECLDKLEVILKTEFYIALYENR